MAPDTGLAERMSGPPLHRIPVVLKMSCSCPKENNQQAPVFRSAMTSRRFPDVRLPDDPFADVNRLRRPRQSLAEIPTLCHEFQRARSSGGGAIAMSYPSDPVPLNPWRGYSDYVMCDWEVGNIDEELAVA